MAKRELVEQTCEVLAGKTQLGEIDFHPDTKELCIVSPEADFVFTLKEVIYKPDPFE